MLNNNSKVPGEHRILKQRGVFSDGKEQSRVDSSRKLEHMFCSTAGAANFAFRVCIWLSHVLLFEIATEELKQVIFFILYNFLEKIYKHIAPPTCKFHGNKFYHV
jgi:hypothetical protein